MVEKPYRWTVDVEYDFGGRTNGARGLQEGVLSIIGAFKKSQIRALFFISTELVQDYPGIPRKIKASGHELGSHGHFHTIYKEAFRAKADKALSMEKIRDSKVVHYRAPKFSYITEDLYSNPKNHVSLLRHMWFKEKIKPETIIYLHPFDIVETQEVPPNLFCRLWYSRPKKAYKLFEEMVNKYK